jgi:hypothetical protein
MNAQDRDDLFRQAMMNDATAVGDYLGRLAVETRKHMDEGDSFDGAIRTAAGIVDIPRAMLDLPCEFFAEGVTSLERKCVAILLDRDED